MRYKSEQQAIEMGGVIYWINGKRSGVYWPMLNRIVGQLEAMLSHHSKIHVLRLDLHQSAYTETNKRMTIFNRRFFKWLKKTYSLKRIGYVWVREQEKAKQQHYHYALIIDGHKVQHSKTINDKATQIWRDLSGFLFLPVHPFHNVTRGNYDETQTAIYRISYLAKARGKGYRPPQTKDYSTSRIATCLRLSDDQELA